MNRWSGPVSKAIPQSRFLPKELAGIGREHQQMFLQDGYGAASPCRLDFRRGRPMHGHNELPIVQQHLTEPLRPREFTDRRACGRVEGTERCLLTQRRVDPITFGEQSTGPIKGRVETAPRNDCWVGVPSRPAPVLERTFPQ